MSRQHLFLTGTGLIVLLTALAVGIPLFIRMPPWCDLTLYDVAAHTVIKGGTLFEDVFDTNLPGFVWSLIGIRRVFGSSVEAVRIIDLLIVTATIGLLMRFCMQCGADRPSRVWLAATTALFYPFTTEFSHCQRDVWMTLPVLMVVMLRVRRITNGSVFQIQHAVLEGVLWGVAVWFKPHVLLIAAAVWFASRSALRHQFSAVPRVARRDFLGNVLGGAIVGILGVIAMISTGTWKPFIVVFTKWNSGYMLAVWAETYWMFRRFLWIFPVWSLVHLVAVPFALRDLLKLLQMSPFNAGVFRRGVLATLYVVVLLQACLLQRNFDYVHIPEMFLAFAVVTVNAPRGLILLGLLMLGSTLLNLAGFDWFPRHRLAEAERNARWSECFRDDLSPIAYRERQQALGMPAEYFSSINMVEIGEVCDFLRTLDVHDGEVIAWNDTPHELYLELDIKPSFRFMHLSTTLINETNFERMTIELRRKSLPKAKYIVTDLLHAMRHFDEKQWSVLHDLTPDLLPPCFTEKRKQTFPYDQPAIFRSNGGRGRYLVHRIVSREPTLFEYHLKDWE